MKHAIANMALFNDLMYITNKLRLFGMKYLKAKFGLAVVLAIVITLAVRLTVFGDDCNLFVVGMTFLLALGVCYGGVWLIDRLHT